KKGESRTRARHANPFTTQPRGAFVSTTALLVEYYRQFLPQFRRREGPALERVLERFRKRTAGRYTEGTLQRLAAGADAEARRAAVLALGLFGTMASNEALAARLHDADAQVRRIAVEALWSLWFRGDEPQHGEELKRLVRHTDRADALAGI